MPGKSTGRQALVVLGMHRSGTSAMTRVLALAGATLPHQMLTPGPHNPEGFWEPHEVMALNERILAAHDSSWNDPFGPREFRTRKLNLEEYIGEARQIVSRNYEDARLIVLKEPRTTLLIDLWQQALEAEGYRVSYVIMVRRPDEVAQSMKARDGTVAQKAAVLWATYMLAAETSTRARSRIFVSFDDLLRDPEAVLDRVESNLDIVLPRRTWKSAIDTQAFLNVKSKHHTQTEWPNEFGRLPELKKFYSYLSASGRDEPWNADISNEISEWLSKLEGVFGPILKQSDSAFQAAEAARQQLEDDLTNTRSGFQHIVNTLNDEIASKAVEHTEEITRMSTMLAEVRSELEAKLGHVRQLSAEISALQNRLAEANVGADELKVELTLKDQSLSKLENERQVDQKALVELRHELDATKQASENAAREMASKEAAVVSQLTAKEAELDATAARAAELEDRIRELSATLDARVSEASEQLANSTNAIQELQGEIDDLQAVRSETEVKLASSQALQSETEARLKSLEATIVRDTEAWETRLANELGAIRAQQDSRETELQSEIAIAANHIIDLQAQVDDMSRRCAALDDALTLATAERDVAQDKNISGEAALAAAIAREMHLREQLEHAQAELGAAQNEAAHLACELTAAADREAEARGKLDIVSADRESMLGKLADVEAALASTVARELTIQNELRQVSEARNEAQSRERELADRLSTLVLAIQAQANLEEVGGFDPAGQRESSINQISDILERVKGRRETLENDARQRLADAVTELERLRAQNSQLAASLTRAITQRRPRARWDWSRLFARN